MNYLPLSSPDSKRILFTLSRKGSIDQLLTSNPTLELQYRADASKLSQSIKIMEQDGVAPILPDGKTGGNACCVLEPPFSNNKSLLVSKSGKHSNSPLLITDVCFIHSFDLQNWSCEFSSSSEDIRPSSDTPLYWACLIAAPEKFQWKLKPSFAMHGHASANDQDCIKWNIPVSDKETRFSTREDVQEMLSLLEKWPYPENKVFLRKKHGFFILGQNAQEVFDIYESQVKTKFTEVINSE
ncbi:44335_t:CDS:2, partial [Gigaspora margarita]